MKNIVAFAAIALGVTMTAPSALAAPTPAEKAAADWQKTVNISDSGGHVMGNPDAKYKIVEYASYTCGHCANFEIEEAPLIKSNEVAFGQVSFEMRNLLRGFDDLVVAVLARCGGKDNFFASHNYWMSAQAQWLPAVNRITPETKDKLQKRDTLGHMMGIYTDMRLAPHAAKTGISDAQARACLANVPMIQSVFDMSNEGSSVLKIAATPTFLINGAVAPGAYDYATIKPLLVNK